MAPGSMDLSRQDWDALEDALRRAASLLRKSRWTQDVLARDAAGAEVDPADPQAKAFCAQGAFLRADPALDLRLVRAGMALLHRAASDATDGAAIDLFSLNDDSETQKAAILAVLERAAALAVAQQENDTAG